MIDLLIAKYSEMLTLAMLSQHSTEKELQILDEIIADLIQFKTIDEYGDYVIISAEATKPEAEEDDINGKLF